MTLLLTTAPTPIGRVVLLVDREERLAGLCWDAAAPVTEPSARTAVATDDPRVAPAVDAVLAYLRGASPTVQLAVSPVAAEGLTSFQRAVLDHLASIPPGETRTYGEVAAAVGHPRAHRAVGSSLALNAVCLARPCHRVVASGGALGGYAGGLERKRWLLELEAGLRPAPLA